jgi:hypothetical protein
MFLDFLILLIPCAIGNHILPIIGGLGILLLYAPILECSSIGATLGKYCCSMQVVDLNGNRISFQAALFRNIIKLFSSALLFFGHFFAIFTLKKQALHDLLADTIVISNRTEGSILDAWVESLREIFLKPFRKSSSDELISQLERLQQLREKGTITESEFLAQKEIILAKERQL